MKYLRRQKGEYLTFTVAEAYDLWVSWRAHARAWDEVSRRLDARIFDKLGRQMRVPTNRQGRI